jgi:hypothetical protein
MTDKLHAELKAAVTELRGKVKTLKRRIRLLGKMGHHTHAVAETKRHNQMVAALVKAETALAVHEIETHPTVLPYMGAR